MASADSKPPAEQDKQPDSTAAAAETADPKPEQKAAALGEDDEFEDFPVDGARILPYLWFSPMGTGKETC